MREREAVGLDRLPGMNVPAMDAKAVARKRVDAIVDRAWEAAIQRFSESRALIGTVPDTGSPRRTAIGPDLHPRGRPLGGRCVHRGGGVGPRTARGRRGASEDEVRGAVFKSVAETMPRRAFAGRSRARSRRRRQVRRGGKRHARGRRD